MRDKARQGATQRGNAAMFSGKGIDYQETEIHQVWWPTINVGDFEARRGVPADMSPEKIAALLFAAVEQVNIELAPYQQRQIEQGNNSAEAVQGGATMQGINRLCHLYQTAIFARAKADLLPEYATGQMRKVGDTVAEREPDTRDNLLAESQVHIRTILGKRRASAMLL